MPEHSSDETPDLPFIDYWSAVDSALQRLFGIDTWDAGIEPDRIAAAQDDGDTPEDFALWFGWRCRRLSDRYPLLSAMAMGAAAKCCAPKFQRSR